MLTNISVIINRLLFPTKEMLYESSKLPDFIFLSNIIYIEIDTIIHFQPVNYNTDESNDSYFYSNFSE